jgi:hypothetical protein
MTGSSRRARVRRPRRSNSLKDIGRLLSIAPVAYEESRPDRLLAKARRMADTEPNAWHNWWKIQTANLYLREFGVQLIANDRVFHIHEAWPGAIGAAWLDDGLAGEVLRHIRAQALDGGAAAQEKRLATLSRARENAVIVALRDADPACVAASEEAERLGVYRAGLMRELRVNGHDWAASWQELAARYDDARGGDDEVNPLGLDVSADYELCGEDGEG